MQSVIPSRTEQRGNPEFPLLLKKWRKQKRLSQLDFSLEVGVSQRHLSFLESGRSKPSREMVLQLGKGLDLPKRETNQLLMSAGFAHVFEQRSLDDGDMSAVNDVLKMMLAHHEPFPALVADRNWNLLQANTAADRLISFLGEKEKVWQAVDSSGQKNIYRMTFSESGMRPLISNWEQVERALILRLQRELNADPDNESLATLYREVCENMSVDEESRLEEMFAGAAPVLPLEMTLGGMTLKVFSVISSFGSALDVTADELKVETFFPADDETRAFFERLSQLN